MRTPRQIRNAAKPPKRIARNVVRQDANFARQYLSVERVVFVKSLPCAACGVEHHSENAHLLGNDGASRKGPYTEIGPLCGVQLYPSKRELSPVYYVGCHRLYDERRDDFYKQYPDFKPGAVAAETQRAWETFQGAQT